MEGIFNNFENRRQHWIANFGMQPYYYQTRQNMEDNLNILLIIRQSHFLKKGRWPKFVLIEKNNATVSIKSKTWSN